MDQVTFKMESRTILSIIGESGAGKTALISSICGTLNGEPGIIQGEIIFNGISLTENLNKIVKVHDNKNKLVIKKNDFAYLRMMKRIRKVLKEDVAVIAVVGSGMRGIKGVAARVFGAVGSKNINVIMITQGSSELNLAFVVNDDDCVEVVKAIHGEFKLNAS